MNIWLLIFLMAAVTFLPRVIPAFVVDKINMNRYAERFLKLIPYTAMAALVVPGFLSVDPARWYVGAIGVAAAIVISCIPKIPSAVVVLSSVLCVWFFFI